MLPSPNLELHPAGGLGPQPVPRQEGHVRLGVLGAGVAGALEGNVALEIAQAARRTIVGLRRGERTERGC